MTIQYLGMFDPRHFSKISALVLCKHLSNTISCDINLNLRVHPYESWRLLLAKILLPLDLIIIRALGVTTVT